jgi:NTP pyrophosphatase (non-canonical NTP hydrolase)
MQNLETLLQELKKFRDERDWAKYHNHKDMALSIVLESAEVLEHFQWKSPEEVEKYGREHKEEIGEELADVLKYLIQLSDNLGIDIVEATFKKLAKDSAKYPVDKVKGNYIKYSNIK